MTSLDLGGFMQQINFLQQWKSCSESTRDHALVAMNKALTILELVDSGNPEYTLLATRICENDITVRVLCCFMLMSDPLIRYSAIKLFTCLYITIPGVFNVIPCLPKSAAGRFVYLEVYSEILKHVCKKLKHVGCAGLNSYKDFLNQSVDLCSECLVSFNLRFDQAFSTLQCVVYLLRIYIKQQEMSHYEEYGFFDGRIVSLLTKIRIWIEHLISGNSLMEDMILKRHLLWRYTVNILNKLHALYIPSKENQVSTISKVVCVDVMKMFQKSDVLTFTESSFVGNTNMMDPLCVTMDECTGRKLIIFQLSVLCLNDELTDMYLSNILSLLKRFPRINKQEVRAESLLIHVFMEQDDELIETMYLLFRIYVKNRNSTIHSAQTTNPHILFRELVSSLSFDENVLLDWLVSTESNFLTYFEDYMKLVVKQFPFFIQSVNKITSCSSEKSGNASTPCFSETHSINTRTPCSPETHVDTSDIFVNTKPTCSSETSIELITLKADISPGLKNLRLNADGISQPLLVDYSSSDCDSDDFEEKSDIFDKVMSCIIRLHLKLERMKKLELLPLNVACLLDILESVEQLYEL